jgi:AmmeMemoRadiSam system protein B
MRRRSSEQVVDIICIINIRRSAKIPFSLQKRAGISTPKKPIPVIKDLISAYFARLASEIQPSTIVLVGPNHRSRGKHSMAISQLSWKSPFGIVHPDSLLAQDLVDARLVDQDENAFYDEHSIGALIPFIKRYFPCALIVPIIVKPDADTSKVLKLASWLAANTDTPKTLILASLDFSHYRTSAIAQREDKISLGIIRSFEVDRCNEAFVDSRKSLMLILQVALLTRSTDYEIIDHTNSGIIENKLERPCTSYINSVFRRK